ncbi:hypothetical protein RUM43_006871 [Polyplax serrata]
MIIGSATRFIGGRGAVQTVYWRASRNNEKLVKTGKHFNLQKATTADNQGMKSIYPSKMTDNGIHTKSAQ